MSPEPAARGDRRPGRRPAIAARAVCAVATAGLLAALLVAPAWAGSGGGGLGAPAATHRPARHHPTKHRPARHHPTAHRPAHTPTPPHGDPSALHGRAMWIWELPRTDRGELSSIIAEAHAHRITTLIVKSSDGLHPWSQFGSALVGELHRAHLRVCAWQYVYGHLPGAEADLGADAVSDGADCLVVDAEVQYQGKYVAAESYVHDLRKQIGDAYPLALAGLPYVDDHPSFPYSVFLGPGGAQVDIPQMYWRDIGSSVDAVFAHTYALNLPYDRPIDPLGQLYGNPPPRQIVRFRQLAQRDGAGGVSWWDWQDARAADWNAVSAPVGRLPHAAAAIPMAAVGEGARGDLVVWLQEHLVAAGDPIDVSGDFGLHTLLAVQAFQSAHHLAADGIVGPQTWRALLRVRPLAVHWVHAGRRTVAADTAAGLAAAATGDALTAPGADTRPAARRTLTLPVPASASLPARRDEIPAGVGAGGH